MDELDISKDVFRRYLDHGDSVLLANLIHITRQFFDSLLQRGLDLTRKSLSIILPSLSKFDILNPLPELKRDFCALWNEIVQKARRRGTDNNPFIGILVEIRSLYVALHGTDAALTYFFASSASYDDLFCQPASYPLCTIPDHYCSLTTHIQEAGGSTTCGASHSATTTSPIFLFESSPHHVPTPEPSSHSAPSGRHSLPITSPHTATGIVQGITDTSVTSSMTQCLAWCPSGTGDAPRPDKGMTVSSALFYSGVIRSDYIRQGLESQSSASTNALPHSNPQVAISPAKAVFTRIDVLLAVRLSNMLFNQVLCDVRP